MKRFAIYFAPRPGALATAVAGWLGWDPATGQVPPLPGDLAHLVPDREALTQAPRRYGFHATIKAPFRLVPGATPDDLAQAVDHLAARLAPVVRPGLRLNTLDGFLALTACGDPQPLQVLAAEVVAALDPFRAPLTEAEIARRQPDQLTPRQRRLLARWGYPMVMEEYLFHMTLTGPLDPVQRAALADRLEPWLAPLLPDPLAIEDLCLVAEAPDGRFHLLSRHALTGDSAASSRATPSTGVASFTTSITGMSGGRS